MSKEKRRVPKLRFPGFTEDWEQRKLGNIVDFLDGQRKPLKESERTKGKYPYYGASGIIDYINDYLFDENLVLLSEDGANIIDRNYPVCFIATGKYWVNNHAHVLKVKTGVIDKFICESLERLDYTKFNTGTAQPKLNQDICQKIVITIPNEDEQKCISEFLDRINNIITLHQRKLDNLKLKKKALLQKLFPKNGERYPELRFPGFTDAWEQCKFGDLFEYERPDAYIVKSDNYNNDFNMPVLTANKAFILGYTNEENSYNKPSIIFDDFTLDRKYVDFPYMLKSSAIKILISKNQHNLRFLFERLNSTRFEVLGHARHYISVVQNTTTLCPSVDEEVCISNLLTKFDELITLHQQEPFLSGNSVNGGVELC